VLKPEVAIPPKLYNLFIFRFDLLYFGSGHREVHLGVPPSYDAGGIGGIFLHHWPRLLFSGV
jgi:hypothetical protein